MRRDLTITRQLQIDLHIYNTGVRKAIDTYAAENASDDDLLAAKRAKHAYDQRRYQARKEQRT